MDGQTHIRGLEESTAKLRQLRDSVQARVLVKILRAAGRPVIKAVQSKTPKADNTVNRYSGGTVTATYQPGNLRKSIGFIPVKKGKDKMYIYERIGARAGVRKKNDGYYAAFVHEGTKHIKSKNPFLSDAFKETVNQTDTYIKNAIVKVINREAKAKRI